METSKTRDKQKRNKNDVFWNNSKFSRICTDNHVYTFSGKLRLQKGYGSTGDKLTGVVAQYVMIWWERTLKIKLDEAMIRNDLLERFVDDINIICKSIEPGMEYREGKLVKNLGKAEEDITLPRDIVTMKVVRDIANSIDGMI